MNFLTHLAWIYWDPQRVLFTIPIIDHPVVWYGLWFVSGFIIGYALILAMFQRQLQLTSKIIARDIANWPLLAAQLVVQLRSRMQDSNYAEIIQKLDKETCASLLDLNSALPNKKILNPAMQAGILRALNAVLTDSSFRLKCAKLEDLFPKVFYTKRNQALFLVDSLTWFVVAGTIIGARLGHVFFYGWSYYAQHPFSIIKVWEGGLASHGGAIGVLLGVWLYQRMIRKKFPEFSFLFLIDCLVVPSALAGCFIRIGNFSNQEILGTESTLPWAVVFGHPADGSIPTPRHPAQLYEAGAYLVTFILLFYLAKYKREKLSPGVLSGLFFIMVFVARFFIEFVKAPQNGMIDESFLQTGQYLSLPFILAGILLFFYGRRFQKS